jgi:hypothetical protein
MSKFQNYELLTSRGVVFGVMRLECTVANTANIRLKEKEGLYSVKKQ